MKKISIIWKSRNRGEISVREGRLVEVSSDKGEIKGNRFHFHSDGENRLAMVVDGKKRHGSHGAIVNVRTEINPFSFFVEHVNAEYPIYLPEYGVIVTDAADRRNYQDIERDIRRKAGLSRLKEMEVSCEEDYSSAAERARKLRGPTWLGISRDMRIFEIIFPDPDRNTLVIMPRYHGYGVIIPESEDKEITYTVNFGRGSGCSQELQRYLEDGSLPILCGKLEDQDIVYEFVMFATTEKSSLDQNTLRGTHFLVADGFGAGHMFTERQQKEFDKLKEDEINREEETVLFLKIKAINRKKTPAYAYFKNVFPSVSYSFDSGMGYFSKDRVFSVTILDGKPLEQEEFTAFLLPGKTAELQIRIFHTPVSKKRAEKLMRQSFDEKLEECRKFWKTKLQTSASIQVPEKRIEDMIKAGLLHLDLVAYGIEPDKPVAACIGRYCPIGSESAPIIQFFDTMSWHKLAERSLQYFIEKQHEDGFMQNFGGYMLETGCALWIMGEHFRYTKDKKWVRKIKPSIMKAAEYLTSWIERNKKPDLIGKGYGMIDGKVADPEDPYHSFSLNGYAYLGLKRVSEMLEAIGEKKAQDIKKIAEELKGNIRKSFFDAMARSPVVPLGDGTWVPAAPPWPEDDGLLVQYTNNRNWYTHGTFLARDSMLGPLYLIFQEILEPDEQASDFLVKYHTEMFYKRNVAFSQPYYSRHPEIHLKRGEVKSFLKAYYNCFPALIDRQTGSFWEHFFYASPHKTHEEAWFLMETRWMLCMEQDDTLFLLPGIPRRWLKDGNSIRIKNLATYFGKISFEVNSDLKNNKISAGIFYQDKRKPAKIIIRIPHPDKLVPKEITLGEYIKEKESILILKPEENPVKITLYF